MRPDDVLLEVVRESEPRQGDDAVEELWNVVHQGRRFERLYPYVAALEVARVIAQSHRVDIYRRRLPGDAPEIAESHRDPRVAPATSNAPA